MLHKALGHVLRPDGVVVDVAAGATRDEPRAGQVVTSIGGHPLSDPPGGVPRLGLGDTVLYTIDGRERPVTMRRPELGALVLAGWGNLVLVIALGGLALALYVRR